MTQMTCAILARKPKQVNGMLEDHIYSEDRPFSPMQRVGIESISSNINIAKLSASLQLEQFQWTRNPKLIRI